MKKNDIFILSLDGIDIWATNGPLFVHNRDTPLMDRVNYLLDLASPRQTPGTYACRRSRMPASFDGSVEDARKRPLGLRSEILCISKQF
jgi:hypothetical protein